MYGLGLSRFYGVQALQPSLETAGVQIFALIDDAQMGRCSCMARQGS